MRRERLILFTGARALDGFTPGPGDRLIPLTDGAADDLAGRGVDGPDMGAAQAGGLIDAFETAQGILAALEADPAWRNILSYKDYDLRPMALKNLFFALEVPARLVRLARVAADAYPGAGAVLLDGDPAVRRAVQAVLPGVTFAGAAGQGDRFEAMRARVQPVARYGRDRWRNWRARQERLKPTGERPVVICFLDAPHRARIMARTLALLADEYTIHTARLSRWEWPGDLAFRPHAMYGWTAYTPPGAWARIARHVLFSRARAALDTFDLPGRAWLPPNLLWALRYDDVQRYASMIEALEGLARARRPALWITLEDLFAFGKCAAAVGEQCGVPTLNVQHGIIGAYPYRTGIDVVGTFAAFGEASRETLIARGVDPDRIVVTGPVRYDDILDPAAQPDRGDLLRGAGLDPDRPVILFASQPTRRLITPAIKRTALRALLDGAGEVGAQVVIKTHPLEDDPVLDEVITERGARVPVVQGQLYGWLLACDVLVTISSTVVYEAAVAERPALTLAFAKNADVASYITDGIALQPDAPDGVGAALRRLLHDADTRAALLDRQRAFVARNLAGSDGRASERLAALARDLIGDV
ncbi:MAG: CDP-glycerol glycerophosphotransferase family protein [Anaerolineae bacterium]|nr:CDP-glycerol glycerophosphotransferase family protein [Anaerolineae bacterium]